MRSKFLPAVGVTIILGGLFILALVAGAGWLGLNLRPQLAGTNRVLFEGVTYQREVRRRPDPLVVHVVSVDLRQENLSFLVTPGDPQAELPLKARTTSQFLSEFGVQLAINGDGATPWVSRSLLDYYPHSGDPVAPIGFAASQGTVYAGDTDAEPTLYISRTNQARFNTPPGKVYNAISGNQILVERGKPVTGLDETPQPRTAVALDKAGKRLIIIVADGRQPGYSTGVGLAELAEILIAYEAYTAMNLDGGGSSTLVIEGENGKPVRLNTPIDQLIPGRERPVGNHLGIYIRQ